jgi:putative FmdB family regulatory protein
MPTYEYRCKSCGEHLEVVQSFKDDPLTECPACGGSLRKVFGNIGIAFKGSGFYKTDNRPAAKGDSTSAASASSSDSKSSSSSSSSSESKPSSSSDSGKSDSGKSDSGKSDSGKSGSGKSDSGKSSSSQSAAAS